MKDLVLVGSYKRDLKRVIRRGWNRDALEDMITRLRCDEPLPFSAHPHKLAGEWLGFSECHIEPDWLLIYDSDDSKVLLARTGTHADLFE